MWQTEWSHSTVGSGWLHAFSELRGLWGQARVKGLPADLLRHPDFNRRWKGVRIVETRGGDVAVAGAGVAAVGDEASAGRTGAPIYSGRGGIFAHFALEDRETAFLEDRPADAGAAGGPAAGDAVAKGSRDGFAVTR